MDDDDKEEEIVRRLIREQTDAEKRSYSLAVVRVLPDSSSTSINLGWQSRVEEGGRGGTTFAAKTTFIGNELPTWSDGTFYAK